MNGNNNHNSREAVRYTVRVFLKRTTLPILSALVFLFLFIKSYRMITVYAVNPLYFVSLTLAIPSVLFAGFSVYLNVKDMWVGQSVKITVALLIVSAIGYNLGYTYFLNEATNQIIKDPAKYERAVRLSSLYEDRKLNVFPKAIPADASDVEFTYIPLYRYDRETVTLYFKAGEETLKALADELESKCLWQASCEVAQKLDAQMRYEHFKNTPYESAAASPLPDDFTVYVFASSHLDEDTYGILTYAAVSLERGEVILNSAFWWL